MDGIISNAVVRSGGAGRSGFHMILQIGYYSKNIDTVITLPLLPLLGQERVHAHIHIHEHIHIQCSYSARPALATWSGGDEGTNSW